MERESSQFMKTCFRLEDCFPSRILEDSSLADMFLATRQKKVIPEKERSIELLVYVIGEVQLRSGLRRPRQHILHEADTKVLLVVLGTWKDSREITEGNWFWGRRWKRETESHYVAQDSLKFLGSKPEQEQSLNRISSTMAGPRGSWEALLKLRRN
ncbi:hypothetical protein AAY473_039509 [Plecturocebus cupreus]